MSAPSAYSMMRRLAAAGPGADTISTLEAEVAIERTFVDTNVLAYAHDRSEQAKQPIARALLEQLWETRAGVVSTQVLQEFYVVATRKLPVPMTPSGARAVVASYAAWQVVLVDPSLILDASAVEEQAQVSFWDALVIASAGRAGAAVLATEDLQHGQVIGGVRIINPFI